MKFYNFSIVISLLILSTGCWQNGQFGIRGEGPVVERKVDPGTIKGIDIPGSAKIYLTQGSVQEVRIEGQENIIDNLNLHASGEIWHIDNKRSVWQSEPLKIYITMETLKLIEISGSGNVEFMNKFTNQDELKIRISGSGKIDANIDAKDIIANISGSGDLFLKGNARDLDLSITGSGNIAGYDLKANNADVTITGSGGMELTLQERLNAHITGSGSVRYDGSPKVDSSITGSGSVHARR